MNTTKLHQVVLQRNASKIDAFLYFSYQIAFFFAFIAMNHLPTVLIAHKTKPHAQKTVCHDGRARDEIRAASQQRG
jgi:hypothetical protein